MTPSGVFATSDGYINLAASSGRLYERLCDVCEKPEWKTHPQFGKLTDRTANRPAFNAALDEVHEAEADRVLGGEIRRSRHSRGPDQHDRQGLRRSAGAASRHRGAGQLAALRRHEDRRVRAQLHRREERDSQRPRRKPARTPTKCWSGSATRRKTSRKCAQRRDIARRTRDLQRALSRARCVYHAAVALLAAFRAPLHKPLRQAREAIRTRLDSHGRACSPPEARRTCLRGR